MATVLKNMKNYTDYVTTLIYILTFTVQPLIVGTFFGRTAERLAFCIAVGYLAWKWADLYLRMEHAFEEEGNKNETN